MADGSLSFLILLESYQCFLLHSTVRLILHKESERCKPTNGMLCNQSNMNWFGVIEPNI